MSGLLARIARRLLAVGLLCLVVGGVGGVALAFYQHHLATEGRIEEARGLLARLETAIGEARQPGQTPAASDAADGLMMAEQSKGLAIAALQTRLSEMAQSAGLRVESASELPISAQGPLSLVGLRIEISGGDEAVGRLLHGIETARPMLLIEGARLRSGVASPTGQIDASLDIYAALETAEATAP